MFESLNAQKIQTFLTDSQRKILGRLAVFPTINSTNTYLLQCIDTQQLAPQVCFAEQQVAGRGRLDREWFSPPGNIYFSLLWYFDLNSKPLSALSLAISVCLIDVLHELAPELALTVKWPNDVLLDGKKVAGILLESKHLATHSAVVIGVGVNISMPAGSNQYAGLHDYLPTIERNQLAGLILNKLLTQLPLYAEQGFSHFEKRWQQYNGNHLQRIQIKTPTAQWLGTMTGVSHAGELILKCDNGETKRFVCGEVSLRPAT